MDLLASVLAGVLVAPLAAGCARFLSSRWFRVDPRLLSAGTLAALTLLIALASGPVGLAVACLSCLVGAVLVVIRVRRIQLMTFLLVPVLATYLVSPSGPYPRSWGTLRSHRRSTLDENPCGQCSSKVAFK